jgi:hypothetical protein
VRQRSLLLFLVVLVLEPGANWRTRRSATTRRNGKAGFFREAHKSAFENLFGVVGVFRGSTLPLVRSLQLDKFTCNAQIRNALTQTTTLRNVGASMVITSQNFAGTPALPTAVRGQQAQAGVAGGAKS